MSPPPSPKVPEGPDYENVPNGDPNGDPNADPNRDPNGDPNGAVNGDPNMTPKCPNVPIVTQSDPKVTPMSLL